MAADTRELDRLAADFGRVPGRAVPLISGQVAATLHDVKTDAQADAPEHSGRYKRSISYTHDGLKGEVGPEARYGHLVENGGARSDPNPVMGRAAKKNEKRLEERVAAAALRSMGW